MSACLALDLKTPAMIAPKYNFEHRKMQQAEHALLGCIAPNQKFKIRSLKNEVQ
jgi:hypothetical protein